MINATKENDYAYDLTPKRDGAYDVLAIFERMYQGRVNGFITQGMNPLAALPNKKKLTAALSKLKYLVIIDPLRTETGEFWKNYGDSNNVTAADIKTEVIMLPANVIHEEAGSFTSSGRVAQWHWAASEPPGEAKIDREIIGSLFMKLREMYAKDGGKFPDAIAKVTWNYANPSVPSAEELLREISGRALTDVVDPKDKTKVLARAGEQLARLRHVAGRRFDRVRQLAVLRLVVAGRQFNCAARFERSRQSRQ